MSATPPQWFIAQPAAAAAVLRSADLARENAGQEQFIHHHAATAPCVPDCGVLPPSAGVRP